jgi:natural product biosynthesis luciferase-like monooxygenase protein
MTMLGDGFTCVLMGEESLIIQCGELLYARGHRIRLVVSENTAVVDWASTKKIATVAPDLLADAIPAIAFDWFFSIGNLRIIPATVWRHARKGSANFHDGPLPSYAGLNTPAWAIIGGETRHGVTWHALSDGVDTGDIYVQRTFELSEGETSLSLNTKCFEAGIETFSDLIAKIETGTLVGAPQDFTLRTYYSKNDRPQTFATIDFHASTDDIDRLARALDFGPRYANALALPKIRTRKRAVNVTGIELATLTHPLPPGTVAVVEPRGAVVSTVDGAVRILGLCDENGDSLDLVATLSVGEALVPIDSATGGELSALSREIAQHDGYFATKLAGRRAPEIHGLQSSAEQESPHWTRLSLQLPADLCGDRAVAALAGSLARVTNQARFDLAVTDDALGQLTQRFPGYVAPSVPLTVLTDDATTVDGMAAAVAAELDILRRRRAYAGDLVARNPKIAKGPFSVAVRRTAGGSELIDATAGAVLTFVVPEVSGSPLTLIIDTSRFAPADAEILLGQLRSTLAAFSTDGSRRIHDLPVMSAEDECLLAVERNHTALAYDRSSLVHQLIEAQVQRTPDATAVICEGRSLTYLEVDDEANRLAHRLIALGAGRDTLVGLYMNRSCELVIGALAILKAGAAYVPLDPKYPRDRIAMIIADSGLDIVLTEEKLASDVPAASATIVTIDGERSAQGSTTRPTSNAQPDSLAYVIYTSGSTGRPKGVMVEHRNVANFFAGMNERVPVHTDRQPVWLAVTSLSFDISVLELFWTLTRGFSVVVHVDDKDGPQTHPLPRRKPAQGAGDMDFSLYYWGNNDAVGPGAYTLLLDGARFADNHGFRAVWMPERHFHAFGGPYPNPSVTGAAIATITTNVDIRAGSCVLPLHHPARVAEEWAVVDNLSNGRTGLAFASGWMPDDFVLRPENAPPGNKAAMLRDIDIVRRMWRGEKVRLPTLGGKEVEIVTQPRPVSSELKVWVTSAGNPDTYREAARLGANVLTHLLGQSIAELAEKIRIYRETLAETGRNPADYKVTLMLHTLLGEDREEVRDLARGPMKDYLRSAAALIKQYAWAFPAFKKPQGLTNHEALDLRSLSAEELDAIIEFAFLRYFDDSGLFGTVSDALARVDELKAIGVNEIACLIDFGVPTKIALDRLKTLAKVVAAVNPPPAREDIVDYGFAGLIRRYGVTHLQCTPAMATMLLMDDENREALRAVRHLFIGGEALQATLLRKLRQATDASIENMYGPTETTVWSSTGPAVDTDRAVPLGTPIANTQLYILDEKQRLVALGLPGELCIGGDSVTRGYLNRDDLTKERFLANPFKPGERMYRTGDLVRLAPDGTIQFIGRTDHQVKVRGYRIELGEIEACIGAHPAVHEVVVIVRQDKENDARIVAYIRYKSAALPDDQLRMHVRSALPEFMVPAHFVQVDSFPLTPNAKIDRQALPPPDAVPKIEVARRDYVAPDGEIQVRIADAFKRILGIDTVGVNDNFFTIGGHSLLAVQVHRDLKASVASDISITDIYRFPTVAGLASHLTDRGQANKSLSEVADRAAMRRNARAGRLQAPARAREST